MALSKIINRRLWTQLPKFVTSSRCYSRHESPDEINCRFECFFNRRDIDGWDIRQGMNDLLGHDLVPEPHLIKSVLQACRRVNDYALTVRFLEAVKNKCGDHVKVIYPYIVQEIAPTLCELGCDIPENLCYHKPELNLKTPDEM